MTLEQFFVNQKLKLFGSLRPNTDYLNLVGDQNHCFDGEIEKFVSDEKVHKHCIYQETLQ